METKKGKEKESLQFVLAGIEVRAPVWKRWMLAYLQILGQQQQWQVSGLAGPAAVISGLLFPASIDCSPFSEFQSLSSNPQVMAEFKKNHKQLQKKKEQNKWKYPFWSFSCGAGLRSFLFCWWQVGLLLFNWSLSRVLFRPVLLLTKTKKYQQQTPKKKKNKQNRKGHHIIFLQH
jgi:hypothetical protein